MTSMDLFYIDPAQRHFLACLQSECPNPYIIAIAFSTRQSGCCFRVVCVKTGKNFNNNVLRLDCICLIMFVCRQHGEIFQFVLQVGMNNEMRLK